MPYYKNSTDFIQPVTIDGKRYVVKPWTTIYSNRELNTDIYSFLEEIGETDDATELTPLKTRNKVKVPSNDAFNELKRELESVKRMLGEKASRQDMVGIVNETLKDTPKIEEAEIKNAINTIDSIESRLGEYAHKNLVEDISQKIDGISEWQDTINRRLGILKDVVKGLESVIYNDLMETDSDEEDGVENFSPTEDIVVLGAEEGIH